MLRQVCNVSYAAQVERMDEKEFAHFRKGLDRDPSRGPLSRGTENLLALMGGQRAPGRR